MCTPTFLLAGSVCACAQVQYLARLLAIVGIVVLPERLEQLSGTGAEQAAAAGARTAPLGSLEQPRGRLRAVDRPPRPEEGAPLDEVSLASSAKQTRTGSAGTVRPNLMGLIFRRGPKRARRLTR